jgi:hypothetical protein
LAVKLSESLGRDMADPDPVVVDLDMPAALAAERPDSNATAASVRRKPFLMGILQWNPPPLQ